LARERFKNGAMTAALPFPVISARVDACMAAIFSAAMRLYSAALQVPRAIITERWKIVSQDAAASWAMPSGMARDDRRVRFVMPETCIRGCVTARAASGS